jgi:ketosteroid isomerase-like protein
MSEENVETVRANLEEFIRTRRPTPHMSADFVWDLTNYEGWPDKAVYAGQAEWVQFVETWLEPFDTWTMDIERILAAGGDQVVVILLQHGRLKGSSAEVEMRYGAVYTVREGVILRADAYSPAERALEAFGLANRGADVA